MVQRLGFATTAITGPSIANLTVEIGNNVRFENLFRNTIQVTVPPIPPIERLREQLNFHHNDAAYYTHEIMPVIVEVGEFLTDMNNRFLAIVDQDQTIRNSLRPLIDSGSLTNENIRAYWTNLAETCIRTLMRNFIQQKSTAIAVEAAARPIDTTTRTLARNASYNNYNKGMIDNLQHLLRDPIRGINFREIIGEDVINQTKNNIFLAYSRSWRALLGNIVQGHLPNREWEPINREKAAIEAFLTRLQDENINLAPHPDDRIIQLVDTLETSITNNITTILSVITGRRIDDFAPGISSRAKIRIILAERRFTPAKAAIRALLLRIHPDRNPTTRLEATVVTAYFNNLVAEARAAGDL